MLSATKPRDKPAQMMKLLNKGFSPLQTIGRRHKTFGFLRGRQKKNKVSVTGFTLAELLLAAAILAFALVSLLALFINCIFLNDTNRNLSIAIGHAQYAMEEIKNTAFGSIIASYNGTCWNSATIESRGLIALTNESVCFQITGTTLLDAVVTVNWRDRGLRDRSTTLETLITEP